MRRFRWTVLLALLLFLAALASCSLRDETNAKDQGGGGTDGDNTLISAQTNLLELTDSDLEEIANAWDLDLDEVKAFISEQSGNGSSAAVTLEELKNHFNNASEIEALPGEFTINSNGDKVRFAPGNLYWNGNSWGFEKRQYDFRMYGGFKYCVNGKTGDMDVDSTGVFLWSPNPEIARSAAVEREISKGFYEDGEGNDWFWPKLGITSLNDKFFANDDSVMGSEWTVLTNDEWDYILNRRPNARSKVCRIDMWIDTQPGSMYICGAAILPDNCIVPEDCPWQTNEINTDWELSQHFSKMEEAGAVFFVNMASPFGEAWLPTIAPLKKTCTNWNSFWTSSLYYDMDAYCGGFVDVVSGLQVRGNPATPGDTPCALYYPYRSMVRMVKRI